ncbi:MAG: 4'-phosphopantetheinyl transferase superfamily protein [Clostridia bacterium]|nr:4'-phosphopantetheinyl transferase superfamily protein [Clostridia bacterium]
MIADTEACRELLRDPGRFCGGKKLGAIMALTDPKLRDERLLARLALAYAVHRQAAPVEYGYDSRGKPVMEGGYISVSHSGRFAAAAFSPVPVGVDVEAVRPVSAAAALRFLCPKEAEAYYKDGSGQYALCRFVMKEAFLKLTGEGIFARPDTVYETAGRVFRKGVLAGFALPLSGDGYEACLVTKTECETEVLFLTR